MSEFVASLAETQYSDEAVFVEQAIGEIVVDEFFVSSGEMPGSFNSAV